MSNKLTDLNNHLFAQIDRLADTSIDTGKLETEINRSQAIVKVSDQIIKTASLSLKACELRVLHGDTINIDATAPMIEHKNKRSQVMKVIE